MNCVFLAFLLAVVFILIKTNIETYIKASNLESGSIMLINSNGDIVFRPLSDIDAAINLTAGSLNTDMSNNFNNFRIASNGLYAPVGDYAYKTVVPPAYQRAGTYQPAGNYVRYNDPISLQSKDNSDSNEGAKFIGRWGNRIQVFTPGIPQEKTDATKFFIKNNTYS